MITRKKCLMSLVFFAFLMIGCDSGLSDIPISAFTEISNITLDYPPCDSSTISADENSLSFSDVSTQNISELLYIKEYTTYYSVIDLKDSVCKYSPRIWPTENIKLNSGYEIKFKPIEISVNNRDWLSSGEIITVAKSDYEVFDVETLTYGGTGLLQFWTGENHWFMEIKTVQPFYFAPDVDHGHETSIIDIIENGVSLKKRHQYDDVFGFQIMAGKPFYFFRKGDEWGVRYGNQEVKLNYDRIPYTNPFPGMEPSVIQYKNMVLFQAERDNQRYSVVIGALQESP